MPRRTWTDDDLRAAVADAHSWSDVIRALGLSEAGSARGQLRRAARRAGIAYDRLDARPSRTWTDEQLMVAVAEARNLAQVFALMGLKVGGGSWVAMLAHIERLGLDTDHWAPNAVRPGRRSPVEPLPRWTDDEVREAAEGARSVAAVLGRLGLDPSRKRGRAALIRRLDELGIDHRSWLGQRWASGRRGGGRPPRPLTEILVRGSKISTSQLRRRLIAEGVFEARCVSCELVEWLAGPIPLQLDHIDGDRTNNELQNLRLLCPNCHALTDTYCGRNIGRV